MSLDLEEHLVFYGAYHHNHVNIAIHVLCVPLLLVSGFAIGTATGPLFASPDFLSSLHLEPNLGTFAALIYAGLYVLFEPVAGTALGLLCMASVAGCNYLQSTYGSSPILTAGAGTGLGFTAVAAATHVVCWLLQFVGHGVFEGRAPALLDNLLQAFILAPLFVWMELLFAVGYRPELRARTEKKVEEEIKKWKESKAKAKNEKAA